MREFPTVERIASVSSVVRSVVRNFPGPDAAWERHMSDVYVGIRNAYADVIHRRRSRTLEIPLDSFLQIDICKELRNTFTEMHADRR